MWNNLLLLAALLPLLSGREQQDVSGVPDNEITAIDTDALQFAHIKVGSKWGIHTKLYTVGAISVHFALFLRGDDLTVAIYAYVVNTFNCQSLKLLTSTWSDHLI